MAAVSSQTVAPQQGENESIIQLLEHFKDDDGRVALLVKELQELSNRVQVAELATVDPRLTATQRGTVTDPHDPHHHRRGSSPTGTGRGADAFADAVQKVRQEMNRGGRRRRPSNDTYSSSASPSGGEGGSANGGRSQAPPVVPGRVEEAELPEVPSDPSQPLPLPPAGHEWEALQAAVNDSVASFGAAAAKMGWKKWALTRAHSALLVSLFWWVVAAAFRSEHPLSRPLQDFAFGHFCRHYVTVVLQLRGRARDQYQQVWIDMMAAAALYLLSEVFPRSQHKFDDGLRALITKQLRLWTAGALPADMHPSAHADAHDAAPAAFAVATAAAAAAAAAATQPNGARGGGGGPQPGSSGRSGLLPPAEMQMSAHSLAGGGKGGQSGGLHAASMRGISAGTLNRSVSGRAISFASSVGPSGISGNTNNMAGGGAAATGQPGGGGGGVCGTEGAGGARGPQSFVFTKNSPVMAQMLAGGPGGTLGEGGGGAPPVAKGLMKHTIGSTLARLHRALDEASDEELSYGTLAATATSSATDAVAAYEAAKRAAAAEAAAERRGLVEARAAIEARQRAALAGGSGQVKQLSDRLSGYIQNDVDRLLAGQPTSTEPASTTGPRYLRPMAGQRGAGGAAESASVKPARLMAPLYELRRVEGNIRAALAGGRHSSTDTVARATAVAAAREAAAAADWRPLAQHPVGTKDTRRRKMAAHILYGLDLEQYAL